MYNSHVLQPVSSNRIVAAGLKLYELIKLAIAPSVYRDTRSKEYLSYILNAVTKGYTVLDIGAHKRSYLFDLSKISKLPGKLVAFETAPDNYRYLSKMKQLMKLENIAVEELNVAKKEGSVSKTDHAAGATIIDFKTKINMQNETENCTGGVDKYCANNFIIPAVIKVKLEANSLGVLHDASQLLQKYKPQVLLECVEGCVSRDTLIKTFKFLSDLNYSGSFILDTIKVPLANFDFNIYQNEVLGFYCTTFIFE